MSINKTCAKYKKQPTVQQNEKQIKRKMEYVSNIILFGFDEVNIFANFSIHLRYTANNEVETKKNIVYHVSRIAVASSSLDHLIIKSIFR